MLVLNNTDAQRSGLAGTHKATWSRMHLTTSYKLLKGSPVMKWRHELKTVKRLKQSSLRPLRRRLGARQNRYFLFGINIDHSLLAAIVLYTYTNTSTAGKHYDVRHCYYNK